MAEQYIFTMHRMRKAYGPDRAVLDDISLAFLPGAKIGVLGLNGAGKSTLLRIMAGVDTPSNGEAILAPGARVGLLTQEPELDPAKDVRGNVEEGVASTPGAARALRRDRPAPGRGHGRRTRWRRCSRSTRTVQDAIERADAWDLDRQLEMAMDALRCPPGDAGREHPLRGRAAPRRALPAPAPSPDLLLLDEPTNHLDAESVAWLERFLSEYPGTVVAVTHDRYFLDNVAGWILELDRGPGHPLARATTPPGWSRRSSGWPVEEKQESARRRTLARELEWVRMNPAGPAGQEQGARGQLRAAGGRGGRGARRDGRDPHPGRAAPGRPGGRGRRACARGSATAC